MSSLYLIPLISQIMYKQYYYTQSIFRIFGNAFLTTRIRSFINEFPMRCLF